MSGAGGKSGGGGQTTTQYAGIQVQTSLKGVPIPRGWGTFKADCNLLDYTNFISTPNKSSGKSSGGKGGGGKSGSGSYNYTANVLLGIVSQQIYGIRTIWRDSDVFIDGTSSSTSLAAPFAAAVFSLANTQSGSSSVTSTTSGNTRSALAQAGLSLATGVIGQAVCSALTSSNTTTYWQYNANQTAEVRGQSHALGYSGLAYVYASNYTLNSGATIPNHSFEVQTNIRQVIAGQTQDDANGADIVNDFLPSIPQWPAGIIGDTTAFYTYCLAAGLLISPYLGSQRTGADLLTEILACTNTNAVWSNGQLQFVPYGDTAITANGVTFTPNLTPIYDLQWSDILDGGGADPIKWDMRKQAECYNSVQVQYLDRTNQYVTDIMPANDPANIAAFGLNKQDPVTMNSVCLSSVAQNLAQLLVQRSCYINRTCTFKLPWTFGLLDPMDLVTVPLRNGGRRLIRILEADEKNGEISITAEEMLVGAAHAATYTRQTASPSQVNASADPGGVSTPLVIHPPASLVNDNEVWLAACSNYDLWGGAVVWASTDGANYNAVGTLRGASAMGVLTAALPSYTGTNPDTADTLAVNMAASAQVLETVTENDAAGGVTLAIIDNELVSYQTATLSAINAYSLTSLQRGYGGTTPAAHEAGAPIVFLNGPLFKFAFNANQIGSALYFKLQSFNIYGGGFQDLGNLTAYSVTLAQTYTTDVAWANVYGTGKPADNATVGAPSGTNVGSVSADSVATAVGTTIPSMSASIDLNANTLLAYVYDQQTLRDYVDGLLYVDGNPVNGVIGGITTAISNEQTQRIAGDTALAQTIALLGAASSDGTAFVLNYGSVQSSAGETLATTLSNISATAGGASAAAAAAAASITTIQSAVVTPSGSAVANVTLQLDANGHLVGYQATNNGTTGSIVFAFDNFSIINPATGLNLFQATGSVVRMHSVEVDTISVGSVGTSQLAANSVTEAHYATLASDIACTSGAPATALTVAVSGVGVGETLKIVATMSLYSDNDLTGSIFINYTPPGGSSTLLRSLPFQLNSDGNTATYITIPAITRLPVDTAGTYTFTVGYTQTSGTYGNATIKAGSDLEVTRQKA